MSERKNPEPPARSSYAVGAGLGLLIGGIVGLFTGHFLIDALLGIAIGVVMAYLVTVRA